MRARWGCVRGAMGICETVDALTSRAIRGVFHFEENDDPMFNEGVIHLDLVEIRRFRAAI